MRLIDADWVLDHLKSYEPSDEEWIVTGGTALRLIHNAVDNAPTVDAVVVTRCKACVHWDDDPDTYGADYGPKGKCMKSFEMMCADDFCSYGDPKEGTNADNYD